LFVSICYLEDWTRINQDEEANERSNWRFNEHAVFSLPGIVLVALGFVVVIAGEAVVVVVKTVDTSST
jgi:hypothetical protein